MDFIQTPLANVLKASLKEDAQIINRVKTAKTNAEVAIRNAYKALYQREREITQETEQFSTENTERFVEWQAQIAELEKAVTNPLDFPSASDFALAKMKLEDEKQGFASKVKEAKELKEKLNKCNANELSMAEGYVSSLETYYEQAFGVSYEAPEFDLDTV